MKYNHFSIFVTLLCLLFAAQPAFAESTRKERRGIMKGNELYKERNFVESQQVYEQVLVENPNSAVARYNLGLSQIRQVSNPADTTAKNKAVIEKARKNFSDVAALAKTKPGLAAKANFNLGNIEFNTKNFDKAIEYYKQALRIDPSDDKARKNLRIAQLNLKKDQNKDKNKNQDKNKDQNKDQNQDKNKDQNKDQNKNQDQNKDKQKQQPQQQPQQQNIDQQAAARILQAVDNKESQTRAKVNRANSGKKAGESSRNTKRW